MIPDESAEVEMIETVTLVGCDLFIEVEERGVLLTLSGDDRAEDVSVLLSPPRAREVGELLFRRSHDVP